MQGRDDSTKKNAVKEGKEQDKKEKDMIIFQEMITIPNQEEIDELVEGNIYKIIINMPLSLALSLILICGM